MKLDLIHLRDLAEKLDYKPESKEHCNNLHDYLCSSRVVRIVEMLEAAQKRIAELEANDRMNQQARDELLARATKAEEELARREAAKGEPVAWQFYDDGNWYNGVNNNGHRRNTEKAGYRVRDLYPAPQPATLPSDLDNDSGFVDLYRNGYNKAIADARELGCKFALDTANVKWRAAE